MTVVLQVFASFLLALPSYVPQMWNAMATARLDARMKAMRDAGEPTTMAELAKTYPDPPPGRNAAPLFNAAFEKMKQNEDALLALGARVPIVGPVEMPANNAELPVAMLEEIRAYLKANAEILDPLRKAAALDDCKFPLDFTKGLGMLLPHLANLRQAARLFALEAIERTESGEPDEAADSLVACLRAGRAVRNEPILISTLVRIACDAIAVGQVERWASRCIPSVQALERVERALAAEADPKLTEQAILGERCFGMDIYQNYVLKPNKGDMMQAIWGMEMPIMGRFVLNAIPQAYFKSDMACYIDLMNDYLAATRKPYPESVLAGARIGGTMERRIPPYYFVCRLIVPALTRVFTEAQRHDARLDTARVALVALRYKARHGKLPEALADLAPDFVKTLPPDPFDGKPLRYRKEADGFVIYSVGENGADDGGKTERDKEAGTQPDVGFRVRWPKAQF